MSVILFAKSSVYQDMADSYEGLKPFMRATHGIMIPDEDAAFYTALRRYILPMLQRIYAPTMTKHRCVLKSWRQLTRLSPCTAMLTHL